MKSNINEIPLKEYGEIPSLWNDTIGYNYAIESHYEDGWRDLIIPEIDHTLERLGELYFDEGNDVVSYSVMQKTVEEIENEILQEAKLAQEEALMAIKNSKILSEIQEFEDEDALQNQSAYPLWEADVYVSVGEKRQDLDVNNELKLFKCVQAHTTQSDWRPKDTPALWVEVAPDGVIPVWVQPLGAHDAYQIDDLVHFPTESDPVYRNTVANNVYAPNVYGWVLNNL